MCITTNQPDTKSNPYPKPNPNPTTKQHAVVRIQLNIVTCPTCPEKFTRDDVTALFLLFSVVTVALTSMQLGPFYVGSLCAKGSLAPEGTRAPAMD